METVASFIRFDRAVGSRRGAVDLVGQDDVGEDGALLEDKLAGVAVVDANAQDIAGEHVRGELDAGEGAVDALGHGVARTVLPRRDVLDEDVARPGGSR